VHNSKMIFRVSWITKKRILQPSVQLKDLTLEIRLKTQLNLMSVA
jgi:hypothetical protein